MPYKDRLNQWLIVRLLPNMQRITVAQFYNRSDAEGYMQIIRQLIPNAQFEIVFNVDAVLGCSTTHSVKPKI